MKLAVLGKPIAHSRSPQIHRAAYDFLGLDWDYSRFECDERELRGFLDSRDESWLGFSLTMPLKEEAFRLSGSLDSWAQKSGVVNTLRRHGDAWAGYNTDIPGLARALASEDVNCRDVVILGTGATAESAVNAAQSLGSSRITVVGRREEAARSLAEKYGVRHSSLESYSGEEEPPPTAVVSTLPGDVGEGIAVPDSLLEAHLFDVAYSPWPSPLSGRWRERGAMETSGIHMLYQQALIQVRIFVTGSAEEALPREEELLVAMREAALAKP